MTRRFAVLASGTGSNALVLARAAAAGELGGELAAVLVDRSDAPVIDRCREAGIACVLVDRSRFGTRDAHEHELVRLLDELRVDLVVLAGYMRICGPVFLRRWEGRAVNLHPSLLPAFPGRDAIGDALAAGAARTGVTVHYIDAGVDTGPVIRQVEVAIAADDTRATLARRVHDVEHALLPAVVAELLRELPAPGDPNVPASPTDSQEDLPTCSVH